MTKIYKTWIGWMWVIKFAPNKQLKGWSWSRKNAEKNVRRYAQKTDFR